MGLDQDLIVTHRVHPRRGFTLVELLTVVSIIAVLIAILLPALARAQAMARRVEDLSNLKQLSAICIMYAGENHGFPPVGRRNTFYPTGMSPPPEGLAVSRVDGSAA